MWFENSIDFIQVASEKQADKHFAVDQNLLYVVDQRSDMTQVCTLKLCIYD